MYRFSYAEVLEETPQTARERERAGDRAFDRSAEGRRGEGQRSRECVEAIYFLRRLWAFLIEDLAKPENDLPKTLRADLISVGLWIMREAEQVRLAPIVEFQGADRGIAADRRGVAMKKGMQISLKPGERIFINGAVIQVDRKVTLELLNDVSFLLESHVMQAESATTPLRQLYFIAQTMLMDPANAEATYDVFKNTHSAADGGVRERTDFGWIEVGRRLSLPRAGSSTH